MNDQFQDWMDWTSGEEPASAGDLLLTKAEIEEIVDGVMGRLGAFHTDPAEIPTTATARPRGSFADPHDLRKYLEDGGLLGFDETGEFVPSPIVHILKLGIGPNGLVIYEVWIDDQS